MADDLNPNDENDTALLPTTFVRAAEVTLDERKEQFLAMIEDYSVTDGAAALAVGVDRVTAWRWKKDPVFKERYDKARKVCLDQLVKEAERRAVNGSDRLLMFLLEHYDPERFGKREEINLGNAKGKPLQITAPEAAERVAQLMALAARRKADEDELESLV